MVTLMLVNSPVMLGLMATAPSLIVVLLGVKWLPCVPYLQALCVGGLLWPMQVANLNVLKAMGRSDLFFRVGVVKQAVWLATLAAAATVSVLAVACSRIVLSVFAFGVNAYYTGVLLGYSPLRQIRDVLPCLAAGGLMALAVWCLGQWLPLPPAALLAVQGLAGAAAYVGLCALFRISAFQELLQEVRSFWAARRSLAA
jgi:O-antigen/teichoic acid export membrane protein